MKAYRHIYLDFPDFTQESRYEVTSKVTFQNGVEDEIKTTVVCDDPYNAMEMVRDFLLSKRDWLVTEVHGQSFEGGTVLVAKPEIPQSKYVVVCDNMKRIFYADNSYKEVEHYSVIYTVPNDSAVYYGRFDTKETADERCEKLNKMWEEWFGEQK
nr:MAG TPA: hypothetical protein [Caudoviricetes sp.]